MRLILALLSLSTPALAANDCVTLKPNGSEVCRTWGASGIDVTYRGSLISAEHGVYAKGTINGIPFKQLLAVGEPLEGTPLSAFASIQAKETGAYDVVLNFVDDTGKVDANGPFLVHLQ